MNIKEPIHVKGIFFDRCGEEKIDVVVTNELMQKDEKDQDITEWLVIGHLENNPDIIHDLRKDLVKVDEEEWIAIFSLDKDEERAKIALGEMLLEGF